MVKAINFEKFGGKTIGKAAVQVLVEMRDFTKELQTTPLSAEISFTQTLEHQTSSSKYKETHKRHGRRNWRNRLLSSEMLFRTKKLILLKLSASFYCKFHYAIVSKPLTLKITMWIRYSLNISRRMNFFLTSECISWLLTTDQNLQNLFKGGTFHCLTSFPNVRTALHPIVAIAFFQIFLYRSQ